MYNKVNEIADTFYSKCALLSQIGRSKNIFEKTQLRDRKLQVKLIRSKVLLAGLFSSQNSPKPYMWSHTCWSSSKRIKHF